MGTELEYEILELINNTIEGEYVGSLAIITVDDWYELRLYLNQEQSPMVLGFQGSLQGFKEFVIKEFKSRKMEKVSYWEGIKEIPSLVCEDGELVSNWDNIIL